MRHYSAHTKQPTNRFLASCTPSQISTERECTEAVHQAILHEQPELSLRLKVHRTTEGTLCAANPISFARAFLRKVANGLC